MRLVIADEHDGRTVFRDTVAERRVIDVNSTGAFLVTKAPVVRYYANQFELSGRKVLRETKNRLATFRPSDDLWDEPSFEFPRRWARSRLTSGQQGQHNDWKQRDRFHVVYH